MINTSQDEVMALWAGLGYYSKSYFLCWLKKVVEEYEGQFPRKNQKSYKSCGVGPYTSAAIASISFGESIVAIDGNLHIG